MLLHGTFLNKYQSLANLCTNSFLLVTVVGSSLKPHWFENLEYLSEWLKYLYLQFICMFHSLSFFISKGRQRLIWKLNDTIHVSDQKTLIPNHISYLSTWSRFCSLSDLEVSCVSWRNSCTQEKKKKLLTSTREKWSCAIFRSRYKDVFLFTPLKRRTARDNERKISQ